VTSCYDQNARVAWVDGTLTPATCIGGGSASAKAYATVQSYWPQGAINQATLGNGLVEQDGFNNRLQMVTKAATLGTVSRLGLALSYCPSPATTCTSGNNGNPLWQSIGYASTAPEPGGLNVTQTYGYDGVNRLTGFVEGSSSQTHSYDGFGNRWVSSSMPLSNLTPQYQTAFLPASGAPTNRLLAKTYDLSGNQQELDPFTLTYDAENRVMTAVAPSPVSITESYAYDGERRRVQKTGFASTVFVYDGFGNLAAEYGASGTASGTQYLTADHLGSTRLVTDVNGNVVARYDYLPFGEGIAAGLDGRSTLYSIGAYPGSSDGLDVKFTGKERDSETGLDYFGFRYFSSPQGRFTSPDEPFAGWDQHDPQSFNLYGYVQNNPLRYTDPDGHDVQVCTNEAGCVWLSDDAYAKARGGNNPGIVAPGGARPNGDITCGGIVCGHATYDGGIQSQTAQIGLTLLGGKSVPLLARAVVDVVSIVVEQDNGVVIGKKTALDQPGTIRPGERELDLPNLNDPKANWAQNSSRLREAMSEGKPIRDVSAEPLVNGRPANNTGFLRAERNLLENHGWTYSGGYWNPPVK